MIIRIIVVICALLAGMIIGTALTSGTYTISLYYASLLLMIAIALPDRNT